MNKFPDFLWDKEILETTENPFDEFLKIPFLPVHWPLTFRSHLFKSFEDSFFPDPLGDLLTDPIPCYLPTALPHGNQGFSLCRFTFYFSHGEGRINSRKQICHLHYEMVHQIWQNATLGPILTEPREECISPTWPIFIYSKSGSLE